MDERLLVERMALAVREAVLSYVRSNEDYGVILKVRPKDTTRKIDMVAEDALDEFLLREGICARIISEEVGERVVPEAGSPEYTIVYDPVDGSNNLTAGIPYFCTAIALSKKTKNATFKDVEAGAVAAAANGMFSASKGKGAFHDGMPLRPVKKTGKPIYAIYAYGSGPIPKCIIDIQEKDCVVRTMGSIALDICMAATGSFHAVIDVRNKVSVYDIMAGSIILQEAGGIITSDTGASLEDVPVSAGGISILASFDAETHKKILGRLGCLL